MCAPEEQVAPVGQISVCAPEEQVAPVGLVKKCGPPLGKSSELKLYSSGKLAMNSEKLVDVEQGGVLAEVKFGACHPAIVEISEGRAVENVRARCARMKVSDSDTEVLSEEFGDVVVVL